MSRPAYCRSGMDPPGWRAIQCVRSYTAPSTETQVSSSASCSATCAGVKPISEGALPRAVLFAPPTRGPARRASSAACGRPRASFRCGSTVARSFGCRKSVSWVPGGGEAVVVSRGSACFARGRSRGGRPHAASREPVRARTAPSSVAAPAPARFESGRSACGGGSGERRRHRGIARVGGGRSSRGSGARAAVYVPWGCPHTRCDEGELCLRACLSARVRVEARVDRRRPNRPNRHCVGIFIESVAKLFDSPLVCVRAILTETHTIFRFFPTFSIDPPKKIAGWCSSPKSTIGVPMSISLGATVVRAHGGLSGVRLS